MNKISCMVLLLLLVESCSGMQGHALKRRTEEEYYLSTGQVRYFLSEIPYWANGSISGQCFRQEAARFFDVKAVRQSYRLSYEEAIQMQYAFNLELSALKKLNTSGELPLSQEEDLFMQVSEKISSNIKSLQIPDYKKISIVWIDSIPEKDRINLIKKFLNSERGMQGYPMFISFCLSTNELSQWVTSNFPHMSIKYAGHELLSPFDDRSELTPELATYWDYLFKENQSITFYRSKSSVVPTEVKTKKYSWKFLD